jgi:hypothetical protein
MMAHHDLTETVGAAASEPTSASERDRRDLVGLGLNQAGPERRNTLVTHAPAPITAARPSAMRFVWTQVRQALQHVAAMGAFSPYFAAAWESLPVANVFTVAL